MFVDDLIHDWMPLDLQHTIIRSSARLGDIDVVHCPCSILSKSLIATLHDDGRLVHAANCNSEVDLEHAFALGVDQLSTNHVDLAVSIRKQSHAHSASKAAISCKRVC
jgi:glycerophosphoryl diester phosphodiesterase